MRCSSKLLEVVLMAKAKRLEDIINVFNPLPLGKNTFDELYVDTYEARGTNAIEKIKLNLCYSNNPYMKILCLFVKG